ncbi:heterokaryon incompatibility protein [Sordaria brevicollis]|uniref:Heterokaryon incompatibility protein n=1 Tax=Sordaria brevicollis TaxID=83679 RepID=A0AAE0P2M7_SORBR|nr:heterokaryon incompatibility protein [Sordaria brevicollis]
MLINTQFSYDSVCLLDPSAEIRLLDLHPASKYTDDLYCRIYTVPISHAPSYIALSYVWGDNTRSHSISIANEANHGRSYVPLTLTSSLDTCLRHLRELQRQRKLDPRPLWIDQICVNQDDDNEKSFQVMLMRDIYSAAHQTVVWLGPAADGSDKVMDTFTDIGQGFLDKLGDHTTDEHLLTVRHLIERNIDQPDVVVFLRKAFDVLLKLKREGSYKHWIKRPWFTRVWTIQEFCLCADTLFACGYKVAPEKLFSAVNDFTHCVAMNAGLRELLETPDTPTHSILTDGWLELHRLIQRRGHCQLQDRKETLEHLLVENFVGAIPLYATDKRDKVYGLLGLAGDAEELGIVPDYSPASTAAQVLTDTARAILERNQRIQRRRGPPLFILRYGSLGQKKSVPKPEEMEFPSWVPEWDINTRKTYQANTSFEACGKYRIADLVPTSSPSILGIRGFCVDTIVELGDLPRVNLLHFPQGPKKILGFFESVRRLISLSKQNERSRAIYKTSTAHHDAALWRVPIGDQYIALGVGAPSKRTDERLESIYRTFISYYEDFADRQEAWDDYMAAYESGDKQAKLAMEMHMDELVAGGYYLALGNMQGKRPYLTRNGYLGMAPGHSQPGDKVVVFHGDTVPYVVRPVPQRGEGMYLLVGEAYCDGIMDGQLAETARREEFYLV